MRAQERMTWYANKKRTERNFELVDEVFLKLQRYRQSSVVMRRNQKLASKYYSSYTVTKKIGKVAYQLNLPIGSKVHNVFHVSQLKKRIGKEKRVHTDLPGINDEGELKVEPLAILDRRLVKKRNGPSTMVLV